jgi:16S rRNA (guanine966-N2)-methyltransferase
VVTRIAGGVLRGRRLRVARSKGLRPTSERVRAALFSILGAGAVEGARVLDLFAGTGALGMEALSRGAARADFVEVHGGSCREIRRSLEEFGLGETGRVHRGAVPRALDGLEGGYDLIFADPPYDLEDWRGLMERIGDGKLMSDAGLVAVEHSSRRPLERAYGRLVRREHRTYGDTALSIFGIGGQDG